MMKKYFEKKEYDNNKSFAYYILGINWIPQNIIDDEEKNGYIVQKVRFLNTTGINMNREKNNDIKYYEAWKVENQKVVKQNPQDYDDEFSYGNKYILEDCIRNSLGKSGIIKYSSQVYWISEKNNLYNIVNQWEENKVEMSNGLKSTYLKDCPELEKCQPIFKRADFIHKVSFTQKDKIKKEIQKIYIDRINRKDQTLLILLNDVLKDTEYIDIINEIKILF